VKNALIKDGWTITADSYVIAYEDVTLLADLGAERPLAAERAGRKVVRGGQKLLEPIAHL
jgi:XisH protein